MDLTISDVAKRTQVATSKIRYYFSLGLLHEPGKMHKNILKRVDQGLSLENAKAMENPVFVTVPGETKNLVDEKDFLECTGLKPTEPSDAERIELIHAIPP